jgi:hypothetical protein
MTDIRVVTYCSFVDKVEGSNECVGICILEGHLDAVQAAKKAWALGVNPGGEMLAMACHETDSDVPPHVFEAMWEQRHRLLHYSEARELFEARTIREWQRQDR